MSFLQHSQQTEVSDPRHANYTNFLTRQQLNDLVAPPSSATDAVVEYLRPFCYKSVPTVSVAGDFVTCPVKIQTVEKHLLPGARYFRYSKKNRIVHRTESSFRLPLPEHIDFVSPTTRFPSTLGLKQSPRQATKLGTSPDSIRALYNIPDTVATGTPANQQHVAGFLEKYFSPNDLNLFYSQCLSYAPAAISFAIDIPRHIDV